MSARDELARVLAKSLCPVPWKHLALVSRDSYLNAADAVLSEWLPTLADEEAVVEAITINALGFRSATRAALLVLAATLSPTSPPPVPHRAAGEHVDRPGAVGSATGRSASQQT